MFKTDKSKSPKEDKVDQSKYNVLAMKAFEPQVKSSPRDRTVSFHDQLVSPSQAHNQNDIEHEVSLL